MDGCDPATKARFWSDTSCPLPFRETLNMWSISFGMEKSRILFFTAWRAQLFVGVLAAAASVSALAQQQAKVAAAEEPLQEIIVTGSRLAAPNALTTRPVQVISAESK